MLVTKKESRKGVVNEKTTFIERTRTGKPAIQKDAIVKAYPESLQLNLLRKAVLGDVNAIAALRAMEDTLNGKV